MNKLKNWDGYSAKGQAAYDAMFEREKNEDKDYTCSCGLPKLLEDKYCEGSYCYSAVAFS